MKRKIIALISVLALSFSVFAFSVSAVEGEESGGDIIETEPVPEPEPTYEPEPEPEPTYEPEHHTPPSPNRHMLPSRNRSLQNLIMKSLLTVMMISHTTATATMYM